MTTISCVLKRECGAIPQAVLFRISPEIFSIQQADHLLKYTDTLSSVNWRFMTLEHSWSASETWHINAMAEHMFVWTRCGQRTSCFGRHGVWTLETDWAGLWDRWRSVCPNLRDHQRLDQTDWAGLWDRWRSVCPNLRDHQRPDHTHAPRATAAYQ